MDLLKKASTVNTNTPNIPPAKRQKGGLRYIEEVKQEFKKISWTNKDELRVYTKVVVWSSLVFGFVIYLADLVVGSVVQALNFVLRLVV